MHLRLLVSLGVSRNLTRTSEFLSITQPAASRLLSEVEKIVGAPLFDRFSKGLTPNSLGEVMVRRARLALAELDHAGEEIQDLLSGYGGIINIGAVTTPAISHAIQAIQSLQDERSKLKITLEIGTSEPLIRGLIEGRFDFVFARIPVAFNAQQFDIKEVREEEVVFIVNARHPLLREASVTLQDIAAYPWALEPGGSILRQRIEAEFRAAHVSEPDQVLSSSSRLVTLAAIKNSEAIGVVSASVLDIVGRDGAFRQLGNVRSPRKMIFPAYALIRYKDRLLSPAAQELYDKMVEILPNDIHPVLEHF